MKTGPEISATGIEWRDMIAVTPGIFTTTARHVQGRVIEEYIGIVSGEAAAFLTPSPWNEVGPAANGAKPGSLSRARQVALNALAARASERGATVVIGIDIQYLPVGACYLIVLATGTAVRLGSACLSKGPGWCTGWRCYWRAEDAVVSGDLILTTTNDLEGRAVQEYLGIVSGEAATPVSLTSRQLLARGRPERFRPLTFERHIRATRDRAIAAMSEQAREAVASTVVAISINYANLRRSKGGEVLIFTVSGTAVKL